MGSPEDPPKSQRLPGVHFFPIRQIPKVPSASHPKVPVLLSIFCKAKTLKASSAFDPLYGWETRGFRQAPSTPAKSKKSQPARVPTVCSVALDVPNPSLLSAPCNPCWAPRSQPPGRTYAACSSSPSPSSSAAGIFWPASRAAGAWVAAAALAGAGGAGVARLERGSRCAEARSRLQQGRRRPQQPPGCASSSVAPTARRDRPCPGLFGASRGLVNDRGGHSGPRILPLRLPIPQQPQLSRAEPAPGVWGEDGEPGAPPFSHRLPPASSTPWSRRARPAPLTARERDGSQAWNRGAQHAHSPSRTWPTHPLLLLPPPWSAPSSPRTCNAVPAPPQPVPAPEHAQSCLPPPPPPRSFNMGTQVI